tara:strand:- start:5874 stop:8390 length:2517 start_codon:yes stop_codon:yes gene_type:complete
VKRKDIFFLEKEIESLIRKQKFKYMRKKIISLLLIFYPLILTSQLKSPETFFGYELGTYFNLHHQLLNYFSHIEKNSESLKIIPYGKSNEGRELQLIFISNPKNLDNLEEIRLSHLQNSGSIKGPKNENKSIVWLSYNIHGNESSSSEASMKTAYDLITKHTKWLSDTIVIIDPCVNPDGRDRYVNFYKQNRSIPYDKNQNSIEHDEPWHNGRTNHYAFDLNRDWAWVTQTETKNRIRKFNDWLPHIHVDFHEQGINSPYYFAPAVEPYHEVVSNFQREFQEIIGRNHANYFDEKGWLYFTKEKFDLLYPSYGDTYPMFLGSIGMTYEQAGGGIAGLGVRNDENIEVTLKDRIEHHHVTGLSTVEMAAKFRILLNKNYQSFFDNRNFKYKNFVLEGNQNKINSLAEFFKKHNIISKKLSENTSIRGFDYQMQKNKSTEFSKNSLVIPTNQVKGKLVEILLEPNTKLNDSLTYDITAWSLAFAYGLKTIATTQELKANPFEFLNNSEIVLEENKYGFGFVCKSLDDIKFLSDLIKSGIKIRYNTLPLTNSKIDWDVGSIFILKADNLDNKQYLTKLKEIVDQHKIILHNIYTGYSEKGPDMGSDEIKLIKIPRVGLLRSKNSSLHNYGELWHFFEQELKYPLLRINEKKLLSVLPEIDVLILPSGDYPSFENFTNGKKIEEWIHDGGKLIALAGALNIFADTEKFSLKKKNPKNQIKNTIPYMEMERSDISASTSGSIFKATLDETHPIGYGMERYYTLKLNTDAFYLLENSGNALYIDKDADAISGFIGYKAKQRQRNSLLVGQENYGDGKLIYFVDNSLFRGFWYSGKQLFSNALFF